MTIDLAHSTDRRAGTPEHRIGFHDLDITDQRFDEVLHAIDTALISSEPVGGPLVTELENRCAERLGRQYAAAVGSGTDALTIAMRACGIGAGQEVITTAFSFIATGTAIVHAGAIPVYVDVDLDTFQMDLDAMKAALTPRTAAVLAVHLFGQCLPVQPLRDFAARHGLLLIEDAAQAFGASRDGYTAGTYGDAAAISFDPAKVLGGITTGGLVATDDPDIHQAALMLRSHGLDPVTGEFVQLGYNSRMGAVNAAYLLHGLAQYEERLEARAAVTARYRDGLADIAELTLPPQATESAVENHHKFVIRTPRRDDLRRHLSANGIDTKIHYRRALVDQPALLDLGRCGGEVKNARRIAEQVLSLPIHPRLNADDTAFVIAGIRSFPW